MKKILRKILIAGGVLLSVLLLLILAVTVFLPTDKISHQVEVELEKATGAEVSVEGAAVLWLPQLGVTLKNCTVQGRGADLARIKGSANELGDYSINLEEFVVQVAVKPLFSKEVLVDAIRLEGIDLQAVFKGETYVMQDADLKVKDLKISMDAARDAGTPAPDGRKTPVGELIPEELILSFEGHAESFTAKGLPLVDVNFHGDLDARVLTLESITANLGGGLLEGNLEIDYERDPNGFLDFEAVAEAVPASTLLGPWAPALGENLKTDLSGSVRGNCLLGEQDVIRRTLTLNGDLGSGAGMLHARQWLGEIAPYLGDRQDLMDIRFSSLNHGLRLEKGRYMVENLEINGLDTQWQGNGSLGLDGTIDLGVKLKLPAGFTPELGQWSFLAETLRDKNGRINLDFNLTGKAAKPQVGINLGSLQDAAGSDAGEALKKGLGGLLDKWKNR